MNAPREGFGFGFAPCAVADADDAGGSVALMAGQWWFGRDARSISTLLGSCVAVSLWHPRLRAGGMCHFVLPRRDRRIHLALDGRYGEEAIELLVGAVRAWGLRPREFDARLWGGADMFGAQLRQGTDIGARNAAHGRWLLKQHGFELRQLDVAGLMHRHIELILQDGTVHVRYGPSSDAAQE